MLNELAAQARASRVQQSADISVTVTPDGTLLTLRDQSQISGSGNSSSSDIVGLQFSFTQTTPPTVANIKAGIIAAFGSTGIAANFGTVLISTQFHYYVFPASEVTFSANDIFVISLTLTSGQACYAVNIGPNRLF